jgi:hypothetical protein
MPKIKVPEGEHGKEIHDDPQAAKRANDKAKSLLRDFLNKKHELTQKKICELTKTLNDNSISINSIKEGMKETMSEEDYNNASKALDNINDKLNELLGEDDVTLDKILNNLELKSFDEIETKTTLEEKASLNKWLKNQLSKMVDLIEKVSPDLRKKIDNLNIEFDPSIKIKGQLSKFNKSFNKLLDSIGENEEKNYERSLDQDHH